MLNYVIVAVIWLIYFILAYKFFGGRRCSSIEVAIGLAGLSLAALLSGISLSKVRVLTIVTGGTDYSRYFYYISGFSFLGTVFYIVKSLFF